MSHFDDRPITSDAEFRLYFLPSSEAVDDDQAGLLARRLLGQAADAGDDRLRPDMVRFGGVVGITRGARHRVRAQQARSKPAMHQGEDNLTPIPTCMTVSLCHVPPVSSSGSSLATAFLPAAAAETPRAAHRRTRRAARPRRHDPPRRPALRRRPRRRRPRGADARSAPAAEHGEPAARVPDPVRRPPSSSRSPTGACWRWSGSRPPIRAWAPSELALRALGARRVGVQGHLRDRAGRERRHGQHPHLLPRRRLVDPAPTTSSTCRRIDRRCDTLAFGLGKSQNAIIAKLATRHLTAGDLARVGRSFGFDEAIPFELPIEPSHLDVPADDLEFARTAAGFWHSTLSPMHGALLAGRHRQPRADARADADRSRRATATGGRIALPVATPRHVVDAAAAREVGRMMELTTRIGTAKGTFRDKRGPAPAARRGRGQDRHAVGRDRSRLRRLQLVRRLRPRGPPDDRVRRRPGQQPELAHQGDLRRPPHRQRVRSRAQAPRRPACWPRSSPRPASPGESPTTPKFRRSTVDGLVAAGPARIDCPAPRKARSPQHAALPMALERRG